MSTQNEKWKFSQRKFQGKFWEFFKGKYKT